MGHKASLMGSRPGEGGSWRSITVVYSMLLCEPRSETQKLQPGSPTFPELKEEVGQSLGGGHGSLEKSLTLTF